MKAVEIDGQSAQTGMVKSDSDLLRRDKLTEMALRTTEALIVSRAAPSTLNPQLFLVHDTQLVLSREVQSSFFQGHYSLRLFPVP